MCFVFALAHRILKNLDAKHTINFKRPYNEGKIGELYARSMHYWGPGRAGLISEYHNFKNRYPSIESPSG